MKNGYEGIIYRHYLYFVGESVDDQALYSKNRRI